MINLLQNKKLVLLWKKKILIFLIVLICFAVFLRFHNLSNIYIFNFDEEYQASYAMTLVKDFHPIWIGVSAGFLDFYMGPYFTYFTAFWLWFSQGDPLLTAYVAGVVGVSTSVVVFFTGWKFFNLTTGIIGSLLYAGLPLVVFYDQKFWNPMFVQLIVLLMFVSLMLTKKSVWWWLLYAALIGVIFETDLLPIPLALIGIWFFIKGKYFLNKKLVLSCVLVFLLFYWPLLVFDYFHNFSNLTVLGRYSEQAEKVGAKIDPQKKILSVFDTMGRFWYLEPGNSNADEISTACYSVSTKPELSFIDKYSQRTSPRLGLIALSVGLFLSFLFISFKKKQEAYLLLSCFILISLGSYIFYSGGTFEYYLHGFVTLFVFIPGIIISQIHKKYKPFFYALIGFVLILGTYTVLHTSDSFSLGAKKRLIAKVMNVVSNEKFSIEGIGVCHNWEGWRYLFKVYGKTPSRSYTDQNFGWLYLGEIYEGEVSYEVILAESRISSNIDISGYDRINEGGYSAFIKKIK
ncbi:glycosyltransferase family 39 protein [Patescibacteria group bacterium]|nr:glycosyltransferase family 39 protein [Patescibacteria group bacterium]